MNASPEADRLASLWTRSTDGAEVLEALQAIPDRGQAAALYSAILSRLSGLHAAELAEAWAGRLAA